MPTTEHEIRLHEGMHFPFGHLVGVLRDGQAAERAARSLYAVGYTDVVVLDGQPARATPQTDERATNPLAQAWERLSIYLSGDEEAQEEALAALSQGHAIVMVYASGRAQEDQAESMLSAHGARALRYVGRWSIVELSW